MIFERAKMFSLLFLLLPLILLMVIQYVRRFPLIKQLITPLIVQQENTSKNKSTVWKRSSLQTEIKVRYIGACLFFVIFFALCVFALADPRSGVRLVQELRRGVDVVLAFDISRSMNVRDASPVDDVISSTRLERSIYTAKSIISNYDNYRNEVRFGVAIGKGNGILAIPLTDDTEAVLTLLDSLESRIMTSTGTNLESLVDAASTAFIDSFPSGRYVILFSDGEALTGALAAALDRLNRSNIQLYTVGAGSIYGAPVPENPANPSDARGGKKAAMSYLHTGILETAAERSGGIYVDGNRNEASAALCSQIKVGQDAASWTYREVTGSLWHIFVFAAIASLAISAAMRKNLRISR
ncbi:hypothetical protein FACS1894190_13410 [Spirochaetia bacterium]|nr:hypothetical protein FACS1894190_13410 [Spirochaetia bacterium]